MSESIPVPEPSRLNREIEKSSDSIPYYQVIWDDEVPKPLEIQVYQEAFDASFLATTWAEGVVDNLSSKLNTMQEIGHHSEKFHTREAEARLVYNYCLAVNKMRERITSERQVEPELFERIKIHKENLIATLNITWPPDNTTEYIQIEKTTHDFHNLDTYLLDNLLHTNIKNPAFAISSLYGSLPAIWGWGTDKKMSGSKVRATLAIQKENLTRFCTNLIDPSSKTLEEIRTAPPPEKITVAESIQIFRNITPEVTRMLKVMAHRLDKPVPSYPINIYYPENDDLADLHDKSIMYYHTMLDAMSSNIASNFAKALLLREQPVDEGRLEIFVNEFVRSSDGQRIIEFIFQDNGVGLPNGVNRIEFDKAKSGWNTQGSVSGASELTGSEGTGSQGIAERTKVLGGVYFIEKRKDGEQGSEVVCQLPIN